jgi:hypothetical protein
MTDAFTVYRTESPYEIRSFRGKLARERTDKLEALLVAQDWSDFQFRRGQIIAMDFMIESLDAQLKERE